MDTQNNNPAPVSYKTMEEIETRKATILAEIQKDDGKIRAQWHSLFAKPVAAFGKGSTPSKRLSGLMTTGAGVLDAFILGWKLYRKFKR
ncbi:MAG: hypothetical protein KAZ98_00055 [Prevotella sp.]|nr:hypothetical protein [Prevotella sp.]